MEKDPKKFNTFATKNSKPNPGVREDFKALQFNKDRLKLKLVRPPLLRPVDDHDVVILVRYAGVCGTDLHIMTGEFPSSPTPVILGHEVAGFVDSVGAAVVNVVPGDKVVINPNSNCGRCQACSRSNPRFCDADDMNNAVGIFSDGGWAEYCRVTDIQVFKLPPELPLSQAILCEPLSCIAHAWDQLSPVQQGSHILLIGAGVIGQLMAAVFHVQGYRHVIISETWPARRELMHRLETGYEVVRPEDLRERFINDPDWGVDVVVDCSGNTLAMEESIDWLKSGGRLLIFGVGSPDETMNVSPFKIFVKELRIIGSLVNPFIFPKALDWAVTLGRRYLNFTSLGIKTFKLHKYKKALKALKDGEATKVIFKFGEK